MTVSDTILPLSARISLSFRLLLREVGTIVSVMTQQRGLDEERPPSVHMCVQQYAVFLANDI